jgi:hypothetical protein
MPEVTVSSSRNITAADDRCILRCAAGITLTIPTGLSPNPRFIVEFESGTISVATSGGVTINGATTTLTRTIANNQAGFAVVPRATANTYGVSGA